MFLSCSYIDLPAPSLSLALSLGKPFYMKSYQIFWPIRTCQMQLGNCSNYWLIAPPGAASSHCVVDGQFIKLTANCGLLWAAFDLCWWHQIGNHLQKIRPWKIKVVCKQRGILWKLISHTDYLRTFNLTVIRLTWLNNRWDPPLFLSAAESLIFRPLHMTQHQAGFLRLNPPVTRDRIVSSRPLFVVCPCESVILLSPPSLPHTTLNDAHISQHVGVKSCLPAQENITAGCLSYLSSPIYLPVSFPLLHPQSFLLKAAPDWSLLSFPQF